MLNLRKNKQKQKFNNVVIVLFIVLISLVLIKEICGFGLYRVLGQSMQPSLKEGQVVLVKKNTNICCGDVVVFSSSVGVVTHRVVDIKQQNNISYYICLGDNNNLFDLDGNLVEKPQVTSYIKKLNLNELKKIDVEIVLDKNIIGKMVMCFNWL